MSGHCLHDPVETFRLFKLLRETSDNHGLRVEAVQKWCDGQPGDSYCCELCTMVLDLCYQGDSPIPRLKACQDVYNLAKKNGWIVKTPQVGDLFLYVDANDHAHHVGLLTAVLPDGKLVGIAGNTSEDGKSSNGTGCFEHPLTVPMSSMRFVRYPR